MGKTDQVREINRRGRKFEEFWYDKMAEVHFADNQVLSAVPVAPNIWNSQGAVQMIDICIPEKGLVVELKATKPDTNMAARRNIRSGAHELDSYMGSIAARGITDDWVAALIMDDDVILMKEFSDGVAWSPRWSQVDISWLAQLPEREPFPGEMEMFWKNIGWEYQEGNLVKYCKKCKGYKSGDGFTNYRNARDGKHHYCSSCANKIQSLRRTK